MYKCIVCGAENEICNCGTGKRFMNVAQPPAGASLLGEVREFLKLSDKLRDRLMFDDKVINDEIITEWAMLKNKLSKYFS